MLAALPSAATPTSGPSSLDAGVLPLRGVVGIFDAEALLATARELAAADRDVVVDLAEAEHLDCSALQVLLALRTALRASDRCVLLQHVPSSVERYLRLSGLAQLFSDGRADPGARPPSS